MTARKKCLIEFQHLSWPPKVVIDEVVTKLAIPIHEWMEVYFQVKKDLLYLPKDK